MNCKEKAKWLVAA
jgi:hypothetical protein